MLVKDNGVAPEMELENEFLKVPLENRDTKASELTNKRYTFSRKHKKGSFVNHGEGYSLRESSTKIRSREQKDIELVAKNGTVGDESTSDGRGLVKVARQLILCLVRGGGSGVYCRECSRLSKKIYETLN